VVEAEAAGGARGGRGMRWLKRACWIAAWGAWAWLGVGLYRELPRGLGPVVSTIPKERNEVIVSRFGERPTMVTCRTDPATGVSRFRRWNVLTGALEEEFGDVKGKSLTASLPHQRFVSVEKPSFEHGRPTKIVTTPKAPSALQWRPEAKYLLDLESSRWLELVGDAVGPIVHAEKPWALFWAGGREFGENFVVGVDYRSGRRLFEWRDGQASSPGLTVGGEPFFIGDDQVAVQATKRVDRTRGQTVEDEVTEIWLLPQGERPMGSVPGVAVGMDAPSVAGPKLSASRTGRVAWKKVRGGESVRRGETPYVCVVDLKARKTVFTEPQDRRVDMSKGAPGHWEPAALSNDGRAVLNPTTGRLYEVDTGRLLWSAKENEQVVSIRGDRFETWEQWNVGVSAWSRRFPMWTVRKLADGSLVHRTSEPTLTLSYVPKDGPELVLSRGDTMRELPPRVKWKRLVLCQVVLALPIVLLWGALWWRRRQRGRVMAIG